MISVTMEANDGGSLPKIILAGSRERKLCFCLQSALPRRKALSFLSCFMDEIAEAALSFDQLQKSTYVFTLSKKRKILEFSVDFANTDFFHIAGLQYLDDIVFDQTRNRTISLALSGAISDQLLSSAVMYRPIEGIEQSDVQGRIRRLIKLERYLDTDNIIKVYDVRLQNRGSLIDADYVIKSQLPEDASPVFIFLRKRSKSNCYCISSMFEKKSNEYTGEQLFWMKKGKITNGIENVLYKHPNYKG